jgi:anti-repressor protein
LRKKAEGLLFESKEPFPVDLDLAWVWIGYAQKKNAVETLESVFEEGIDFSQLSLERKPNSISTSSPQWEKMTPKERAAYASAKGIAAKKQKIFLTVDCFKQLGMMAQTPQGKQIRRYFLDCEKRLKDYFLKARNHSL